MKTKLLIILFILLNLMLFSQVYKTEHYTTDNGLPQNSVKDIVKDLYGFLWFTTENGIVRYDGFRFLVYKNFPLSTQRFSFFHGNIEGDSIFAGAGSEKVIINKRTAVVLKNHLEKNFRTSDNDHSLEDFSYHPAQGIPYKILMKNGSYLITKFSLIYTEYSSNKKTEIKFENIRNKDISVFSSNGSLFLVNYFRGEVNRINEGKVVNRFNLPLLLDSKSRFIWNQLNSTAFMINDNIIYSIVYYKNALKIKKLVKLKNINSEYILSAYYDKILNKLYLGSSTEGLRIISFPQFTATNNIKNTNNIFYATLPYDDSSVITSKGEIYGKKGLVKRKKFKTTNPYFINFDQEKNIIVKDSNRLYKYIKKLSFEKSEVIKLNGNLLVDILYDNKNCYTLYAKKIHTNLGYEGELIVYSNQSFEKIEKVFKLDAEPTKILKINDIIYIGTINGVKKLSLKTNKLYDITKNQNLYVRNIIKSEDNNVWIMTLSKGFYLVKDNKLIKMPYDVKENLSSPHTILEDKFGFFWIPTNNCLYKVHRSKLIKYSDNQNNIVNYFEYNKDEGFNTNEFNGGSTVCGNKLKNGYFSVPSLDGLVFFDPTKIKSSYPENVYLERAIINGKEVRFDKNLDIDQKIKNFDILVDIPYFGNRNNVVVKLKREESDTWENLDPNMKFSVSNLAHGNHIFIIKLLTSDNNTFTYRQINIKVVPYFYQNIWFQGLCIFFILGLMTLGVKLRLDFLKKKNLLLENIILLRTRKLSLTVKNLHSTKVKLNNEMRQQKRLIGTISHDIATPIKFLSLTVEDLLENKFDDQEKLYKILTSIYNTSTQLYNFTLTLKEYADIYTNYNSNENTDKFQLFELIEEKKELFIEIATKNRTRIINNVNKDMDLNVNRGTLAAIIHNLLDNAVKFTKEGIIDIEAISDNGTTTIVIRDNGIGIQKTKIDYYTSLQEKIDDEKLLLQKFGMGLHLVLQLLQIINAKIQIEENKPTGSVFRIIIKE